jgi:hypothetical protein
MARPRRSDSTVKTSIVLSERADEALNGVTYYASKAGFPLIKTRSDAIELAAVEFAELLRSAVEHKEEIPFKTVGNW